MTSHNNTDIHPFSFNQAIFTQNFPEIGWQMTLLTLSNMTKLLHNIWVLLQNLSPTKILNFNITSAQDIVSSIIFRLQITVTFGKSGLEYIYLTVQSLLA